jgi:hypothetical protein
VRELRERTTHPKISKVVARETVPADLDQKVARLINQAVAMDDMGIRETLKELVPEYRPYLPPEVQSWVARR